MSSITDIECKNLFIYFLSSYEACDQFLYFEIIANRYNRVSRFYYIFFLH